MFRSGKSCRLRVGEYWGFQVLWEPIDGLWVSELLDPHQGCFVGSGVWVFHG